MGLGDHLAAEGDEIRVPIHQYGFGLARLDDGAHRHGGDIGATAHRGREIHLIARTDLAGTQRDRARHAAGRAVDHIDAARLQFLRKGDAVLDGKPALELYKRYLGEAAEQLPGSALLFPLVVRPDPESSYDVVRTIVGVNEENQSLIFAGDIPQNWSAQLMRGVPDRLVDGALRAARQSGLKDNGAANDSTLALIVSCIGRKLMMGQRISDEVEVIREECGSVPTIGFYSYGEICPHGFTGSCTLHNQTMTITVFRETG